MKRGDRVTLLTPAYKDQLAVLSRQYVSDKDGTERWYVTPVGLFKEILFRVDEFELHVK